MKKHSLLIDSLNTLDQTFNIAAIKGMDREKMEKLEYVDERVKAEATDVLAKGFGYLNVAMCLLYVLIPVLDAFVFNHTMRTTFAASILYATVLVVDYILLFRFAKKGIVKGNAASGAVMVGTLFPFGLFLLVMEVDVDDLIPKCGTGLVVSLIIGSVLLCIIFYKIANRAYNRALNEDED